ncbi:Hypothetical predicted protein, partial [Marmota monax]
NLSLVPAPSPALGAGPERFARRAEPREGRLGQRRPRGSLAGNMRSFPPPPARDKDTAALPPHCPRSPRGRDVSRLAPAAGRPATTGSWIRWS